MGQMDCGGHSAVVQHVIHGFGAEMMCFNMWLPTGKGSGAARWHTCARSLLVLLTWSHSPALTNTGLQAEPILEPLILTGKSMAVRAAAAETLAMLCFVGSEGAADTLHTMATLWRVVLGGKMRGVGMFGRAGAGVKS